MDERTAEIVDPREAIARLEEHIEQLAAKLESCQKFAAASRFAMALGGVVTLGSNNSTAKEAAAQLAAAEAERADLIGSIELRMIDSPTLH